MGIEALNESVYDALRAEFSAGTPGLDARANGGGSFSALGSMTERDWEIYRLNVVESMPDSLYKMAVIEGIRQRLDLLERENPEPGQDRAAPRKK
jgi:hypothetical protein